MLSLFLCTAASGLAKFYVKAPKNQMITIEIDDQKKFSEVYSICAKKLNQPVSALKITNGKTIPHRCKSIWDNEINDGDVLSLTITKRVRLPFKTVTPTSNRTKWHHTIVAKKPVIYMYPTEEIDATVSVKLAGKFTAVYPAFTDEKNSEWKVHAYPSGRLAVDGREYTSLFWEGENDYYVPTFDTGFIVTKENAVKFLEEKLAMLGLSDLEANEFITFWIPVLNRNGKSVVSFQFENYQKAAQLTISPKPDTLIRVFLGIRKAEENEEIVEQVLPTFKRQGYTVVEWGGCDI